jgi:peptide/nickel transport system substrate-binding protein
MRNPILANKRVRQALTYALDKEGILKALYPPDYGEIISGPFPPNSPAYDKSIEPTPFDPEKAKRLLDEAGFTGKDKDGYRLNSEGQRLEFKFKAPTPTSGSQGVTTKSLYLGYVDAMKEIGVKINLEFRPWAAWHDEVFNKHDFDLTSIKWNFSNTDITTLFQSKFKEQKGGNNIVGYADPTVDSLLEQSKKAKTPEEFKDICHRLHRIIHDDCPYTFLWSVVKYASYNVRLHKVTIKPFSFFEFIDEWYIEGER